MNKELKVFDIDLDSIEISNNLFDNISEAIHQMSLHTMKDRFEVILNNNLIESKEKLTNYRTIFGCRVSYQDLDKNISFIVREDTKPTYEQLEQELERYKNIIDELEKDLINSIEESDLKGCSFEQTYITGKWAAYKKILNKLKELKGSDN